MRSWNRDLDDTPRPPQPWDGIIPTVRDCTIAHQYLDGPPDAGYSLASLIAWVRMLPAPRSSERNGA